MKDRKAFDHHLFILCMSFIIIVVFPYSLNAADSDDNLVVKFRSKGKPYKIIGERTGLHTYIFNKGAPKKISLTTLNWPPYIGETICGQGWVQQLTIALLASCNYEITSSFLPWARTIVMAEKGVADILYPEYFIEPTAPSDVIKGTKRIEHLALSKKIPGGPIAFMKRNGEQSRFNGNLFNLKDEKIGVVRGYQNTPEFDELMDMGFFKISQAVDDFMNIKKLMIKRINLIIGDPAVIRFSLASSNLSDDEKSRLLNSIEVVRPVIQYNYLYYAVSKKKPGWENTLRILNSAIEKFETSGLMFDIIEATNTACGYQMDEILNPYAH